jgi:formate/nitrite transporter FocA (FNT family)
MRTNATEKDIEDRVSPPGEVIYEAIYREGEHELARENGALALSGLAAGLSMGFSFLSEGFLRSLLPDALWAPLVSKLGYAVGFVIVILGRQQLFTKNTLTIILPMLNRRASSTARMSDVARLWMIILGTNLGGAGLFAAFASIPGIFAPETKTIFAEIGRQSIMGGFGSMFARSILAGWLIALMIWLLPSAETARVWVIILLAYIVGIGHLPHVVAGSVAAFYAVLAGQSCMGHFLGGFLLPVLLGNALGGVALVAVGAHAEFVEEGPRKGK